MYKLSNISLITNGQGEIGKVPTTVQNYLGNIKESQSVNNQLIGIGQKNTNFVKCHKQIGLLSSSFSLEISSFPFRYILMLLNFFYFFDKGKASNPRTFSLLKRYFVKLWRFARLFYASTPQRIATCGRRVEEVESPVKHWWIIRIRIVLMAQFLVYS